MDYKHLLPALYDFIGDAFKWRATVGSILPESLEEETLQAIHKSEVAEYIHAVNHEHSAFNISKELADVLWTGAFFKCLEITALGLFTTDEQILEITSFQLDPDNLQHLDPLVLKAVSVSNWSKIVDTRSPKWQTWSDPFFVILEGGVVSDGNRFRDVQWKRYGTQAILVGTDYQNPDKPQRNKVLKPKGYKSAEEVYRELKEKEGRDD